MKDHQLGFIPAEAIPGFGHYSASLRRQAECAAEYGAESSRQPAQIAKFNSQQFLNPDGSYTPTPAQTMEIVKGVMEKEAKAARARAAYAPILKELNKMDRDPDPAAAQGQLWMGRPIGGDIPCRCDACREARMPKAYANQNALYSKMSPFARF